MRHERVGPTPKILPRSFYLDSPDIVARNLLGKLIVRRLGRKRLIGRITEIEAYMGVDDPASHTFIGKTPASHTSTSSTACTTASTSPACRMASQEAFSYEPSTPSQVWRPWPVCVAMKQSQRSVCSPPAPAASARRSISPEPTATASMSPAPTHRCRSPTTDFVRPQSSPPRALA